MMHNFYIIFIYSVILFRLGFQHEVHTPHYYFELLSWIKGILKKNLPLF
jgi:hypothetical protein